jgi:hypothetical protein
MNIEAMKQALEAMESGDGWRQSDAIKSLRQAIEQAEKQEPFGYFQYSIRMDAWVQNRDSNKGAAFYTTPQPQREWVGLTDEDVRLASKTVAEDGIGSEGCVDRFAYTIEAKLKEKNGGAA